MALLEQGELLEARIKVWLLNDSKELIKLRIMLPNHIPLSIVAVAST